MIGTHQANAEKLLLITDFGFARWRLLTTKLKKKTTMTAKNKTSKKVLSEPSCKTDVSGCVLGLPEIGRTYNCFDDGKIRESRMYQVTIDEIIPFEKADNELLELWEEEGLPSYWLFDKTDYFIKFTSNEFKDEPNGVFARTKGGGWFGLGNYWNSGRLDIDGSLTESLSVNGR